MGISADPDAHPDTYPNPNANAHSYAAAKPDTYTYTGTNLPPESINQLRVYLYDKDRRTTE